MSSINRITLPNGDTYDLIDYEINPYIHHSESNKQLWLNADEYPYGSYISIFTGSASADTASAQIYLKSGNDTFQGTSLYTDYGITTSNKLTTKLTGDNIILNGNTLLEGSQLYITDWKERVDNNYSFICCASIEGGTTGNLYHGANGYHAFYTGVTGYDSNGNAISTEQPLYLFNDRIRVNVPMAFNEGHGTNAASNTFVVSNHTSESATILAATGDPNSTATSGSNQWVWGYKDVSVTVTGKTGYYPIALAGFQASNRYLIPVNCRITSRGIGSCTVSCGLSNPKKVQYTGTITVYITWVKCSS